MDRMKWLALIIDSI
jgi:gamma-tubulin complex component 3